MAKTSLKSNTDPVYRDILVVREPFGGYVRGEVIRDAAAIETVYASEQDGLCIRSTEQVAEEEASPAASADQDPTT